MDMWLRVTGMSGWVNNTGHCADEFYWKGKLHESRSWIMFGRDRHIDRKMVYLPSGRRKLIRNGDR